MDGMRLKLARTGKRIKQLELSRLTGIPPSRLSLIENGWVRPKPEEISAIEVALRLKPISGAGELTD